MIDNKGGGGGGSHYMLYFIACYKIILQHALKL